MQLLEKLRRLAADDKEGNGSGDGKETEKDVKKRIGDIVKKAVHWAVFVLLPIALFFFMEAYEHNAFAEVRREAILFNICLFELLAFLMFFFTGSGRAAIRILGIAALVFGLTNHYVLAFRSTPFVPWDIFSVGTAAAVAGNYDFTPDARIVAVTLLFLAVIALVQFLKVRCPWKIYVRFLPTAAVLALLAAFAGQLQNESFQNRHNLYPFLFTPTYMTKVNGMAVTFTMNLAYVHVDRPAGYNAAKCEDILAAYGEPIAEEKEAIATVGSGFGADGGHYPNVIVIMDEAFSDLGVLGEVGSDEDYMPFVHSLQQGAPDTVTGMLHVSVCGGNTANSEFEFLTGDTMRFLPTGSIPYQQYVKRQTPSLASHLASLGYETYGMHPYYATGWERDTVYPRLGLVNNYFKNDYVGAGKVRQYISDRSDFDKILEVLSAKPKGKPAFIFNVTMQNHGSYSDAYDNFTPDITVPGAKNFSMDQYLSLVHLTDRELERLISALQDYEEDVVLLFFGDHQPNNAVAKSVAKKGQDETLRYQVPFVMWANYDIKEAAGLEMSMNYLSSQLMLSAGLPMSPYQRFLWDLKKEYPVISAVNLKKSDDGDSDTEAKEDDLKSGQCLDYRKLQYYYLFDWKGEKND